MPRKVEYLRAPQHDVANRLFTCANADHRHADFRRWNRQGGKKEPVDTVERRIHFLFDQLASAKRTRVIFAENVAPHLEPNPDVRCVIIRPPFERLRVVRSGLRQDVLPF